MSFERCTTPNLSWRTCCPRHWLYSCSTLEGLGGRGVELISHGAHRLDGRLDDELHGPLQHTGQDGDGQR
jgi:hypothetical protein